MQTYTHSSSLQTQWETAHVSCSAQTVSQSSKKQSCIANDCVIDIIDGFLLESIQILVKVTIQLCGNGELSLLLDI